MPEAVDNLEVILEKHGFLIGPKSRRHHVYYRAVLHGSEVTLSLSRRTKTRYSSGSDRRRHYVGHSVTLEIRHPFCNRIVLSTNPTVLPEWFEKWLFGRIECHQYFDIPADYKNCRIFTANDAWTSSFLSNLRIRKVLCEKLRQLPPLGGYTFAIQPTIASLTTRLDLSLIDAEFIDSWIIAFKTLIEESLALPAPDKPVHLTRFEQFSRQHPVLVVVLFFAAFLGFAILFCGFLFFLAYFRLHWLFPVLIFLAYWFGFRKRRIRT